MTTFTPRGLSRTYPVRLSHPLLGLVGWLALVFLAAGAGGAFTDAGLRTWYPTLVKPPWTPPDWLFGPVWSLLYTLMAVAAWRVSRTGRNRQAVRVFLAQLALNTSWSLVFFGLRRPGAALVVVLALWVAIEVTILRFRPVDRIAAALLLPYLGWVSFATVLNAAIWRLN